MREVFRKESGFFLFLADGALFCKINLQHYIPAFFGLRLSLDPDYPKVRGFFPSIITDTVLEWRVYGFIPLPAMVLGWIFGLSTWTAWLVAALLVCFLIQSIRRARHFTSPLAFWRQAAKESPNKLRCLTRYAEELMREIEAGYCHHSVPQSELQRMELEAFELQERIIRLGRQGSAPG